MPMTARMGRMSTHWTIPLPATVAPTAPVDRMVPGGSAPMRRMKRLLSLVAPSDAPVLVSGPSGSGKELVAQAIHRLSGRAGPLVAINCAAIPADLLEGELFGHERGAYTGADRARGGLIEQAADGTLFLDEIGDLPAALQAKLLRVLETRTVRRLGGHAAVAVDFRLVAATHRDLPARVAAGAFREDLYYRLAVFPVEVPPLSARAGDLPLLLARLMDDCAAARPGLVPPEFDASAIRALAGHAWPGNVRELRTVVQRACLLFPGRRVSAREVTANLLCFAPPAADEAEPVLPAVGPAPPSDAVAQGARVDLRRHVRDVEVAMIAAALDRHGGCVSRAAVALCLNRTTLIEKMRKHGLARA
jgi:sigma-54 specific flagellar transcriptional regulator A